MERKPRTLIQEIVVAATARENCRESETHRNWFDKWSEKLETLCSNLPSGSGIDSGTKLVDVSDKRAIFQTAYHHMNESGMYDGWTEHMVTVTPGFSGINIKISGRNRNDIKKYLHEVFYHCLTDFVNEEGRSIALLEAQKRYKEQQAKENADGIIAHLKAVVESQ